MAPSSFSLLLRFYHRFHHRHFLSPLSRHFSLSPPHQATSTSSEPTSKPSSLSTRLSFVFDKIDEIEKDRAEKDEALQRIRAWRETKKKQNQSSDGSSIVNNVENEKLRLGFEELRNSDQNVAVVEGKEEEGKVKKVGLMKREIELSHPWPEWIAFMERLVQQNYFDHKRKDEDKLIECLGPVDVSGFAEEEGFDFTRDWKTVHTAMVNFGKDRFDILRSLSRQDIQTLVGYGCPSADKKVVFSAKLLRKHGHLDEGDVCSSCNLRNNCERAFLVTNKEDEARTIDVMRVLLTYGFDPVNGSIENKSLLKHKSVKTVVRKLLHEIVKLSAVPIDPNLPPPVIKKRPPKVKQPPPPPKRRVGRDDIEMKKGDWLCLKCNFMNFAKNVVCLQCDAKRPKRQLLPGEWECPQCNFLNYRRNMTCFNCEHKRPPDAYMENQMQGKQQRPVTRLERAPNREQLSNAWNFDFDDDESDGADVATFEYADARAMNEDHHLDNSPEHGTFSRPQDKLYGASRNSRLQEIESPRPVQTKHSMGFDDFDDEDDDIDSYEVDNHNRNPTQEASVRFSDVENGSDSDVEGDADFAGLSETRSNPYPKSSRSLHQKGSLYDSGEDDMDFDSDEDLPVHPKWKSSHVAGSALRKKASCGPSKRMGFGSDGDDRLVFGSDDDMEQGFTSRLHRPKESYYESDERGLGQGETSSQIRKRGGFESHKGRNFVKGNDFDNDFGRSSRGSRGGHQSGISMKKNESNDFDDDFRRSSRGSHGGRRGGSAAKGNDFDGNFGRSSRGSRGGRWGGSAVKGNDFDDDFGISSRGSHGDRRGGSDAKGSDFGRSYRGNQRESFDNGRERHSMSGRQRGEQKFSGSRHLPAKRGERRSNESDYNWSDHDRPLRQR